MKVSIVINTLNRALQLRDCLRALKDLNGDFEVVVVNGPSTDGTTRVCKEYAKYITYVECTEPNLSVSRNIGIAHARGDIVAFIDDDAIVHPMWLQRILAKYTSAEILGVGGFTIDHTGKRYQATGTLCDRLGNAYPAPASTPVEMFCFPGTMLFPSLLGTNSSFRASALDEIGGFDETYAYFLDETDVCLRLIDKGGSILYAPDAIIYHKYAPSHLRNPNKVPTTLHVQSRSKSYYMYRHGTSALGEIFVTEEIVKYRNGLYHDNKWLREHNHLSPSAETLLNRDVELGIEDGRSLSRMAAPTNLAERKEVASQSNYKAFNKGADKRLRIALVSQGYPPSDTMGIARWTEHVARGLAEKGHCVHVITKNDDKPTVDFHDGIWLHKVNSEDTGYLANLIEQIDLPSQITNWSAGVYRELQEISFSNLDVVSAPIWDLEGLVPILLEKVPVVTSLHTTYKLAKPYKPDWHRPLYEMNHVDKMIAAEKFVFETGRYFLGNSHAVVAEINEAYNVDISSRTIVVPHGVPGPVITSSETKTHQKTVLFVGRQETRKGFHTALNAAVSVCRKMKDVRFRFIGVETDDPHCVEVKRSFFEEAPETIRNRIIFEGYVTDDKLMQAYYNCDVFLAPSLFESFGLVAIEAMRYGKPVVAGKVGGLVEVVRPDCGILVNPHSAEDIGQALLKILSDDHLRRDLGEKARAVFNQSFTLSHMIEEIEKAYKFFVKNKTTIPVK